MTIAALPQHTVRALGSSQVLTTPVSVIKELIDNALDAGATLIDIHIHNNTLDEIRVRDNGRGIPPEDRALVCRRYCTSKIREFGDIRGIGGSTLGFRGEALASLAEMSGNLIVATRVEGEAVAVEMKIGRDGEVKEQHNGSYPQGTTVVAKDFFAYLPVRKQTALKQSAKTLAQIKRLVQAYALARPAVRFLFKVLKAKNAKGDWTYAGKKDSSIEEACLKVVGKDCAGQCAFSVLEEEEYEVQAFLPKSDAEPGKISGFGQFVSVDSRPVTPSRGTLKQIVSIVKERLKKANKRMEGVKDPFMWLNLVCPPGSYDPNVEPAKDDVLFENGNAIISLVEKLLMTFYPEEQAEEVEQSAKDDDLRPVEIEPASRRRSRQREDIFVLEDEQETVDEPPSKRLRTFRPNMYGIDEEDLPLIAPSSPPRVMDDPENEQASRDVTISNPWMFAKLNSSAKGPRHLSALNDQLVTPLRERNMNARETSMAPTATGPPLQPPVTALPTPKASSPALRSSFEAGPHDESSRSRISRLSPSLRQSPHQAFNEEFELFSTRSTQREHRNDFVSARNLSLYTQLQAAAASDNHPQGTPLHAIPEAPRTRGSAPHRPAGNTNKPFLPAVRDEHDTWFRPPSPAQTPRFRRPRNPATPLSGSARADDDALVASVTPPERNRDIRDFIASRHANLGSGGPRVDDTPVADQTAPPVRQANDIGDEQPAPVTEPERFRRRKITEADNTGKDPDFNPEAVPPKRHRTTDGPHRSKSTKLPLERVPATFRIQNVEVTCATSMASILKASRKLDTVNDYLDWGFPAELAISGEQQPVMPSTLRSWATRLHDLLRRFKPGEEVVEDLETIVEAAFSTRIAKVVDGVSV